MRERNDEPTYPIDAISMLKADHQKVEDLFSKYESARDVTTRQEIAEQVFAELEIHAQLEEHVFYPAYETQAGKQGTQLAAESRLEHERVKELIIELRHRDVEDEEFAAKFSELMHDVQQHVEVEENEMFPEAEQILADQLEDLMDEMVELKAQFTTP